MGCGTTECSTCGREFTTTFTTDSEEIEGWTRSEDHPDEDECAFCQGDAECSEDRCSAQATVYDKDGNLDYCAPCWTKMCDGDDVEYEECIVRLGVDLHVKPKRSE